MPSNAIDVPPDVVPLPLSFLAVLLLGLLGCSDTPNDATGPSPTLVASVTVSPATVSLQEGESIQLTASVTDASGGTVNSPSVAWTSSNPNVASVPTSNRALTVLITAEAEGVAVISATSGGKSGTSNFEVTPAPKDVTGQYYVAVGGVPRYLLSLNQTGPSVEFSVEREGVAFTGIGTIDGRSVSLTTEDGGLTLSLEFSSESTSLTGTLVYTTAEQSTNSTVTGSTSPWTTYDVNTNGLPLLVEANYIDLESIDWVSLFRSSSGHDFVDDFEVCRSMKHYFQPLSTVDWSEIEVYSPIQGKIVGWANEGDKGTTITIESSAFPGVSVTVFHVSLASPPGIGDAVSAGDNLGTHYGSESNSDIAVGIVTPDGYMLVSYFDVMTDDVFQEYEARGASSRDSFIITAAERDADPLTCEGGEFSSGGTLPDQFDLVPL
jgi:hypothetical protein